MIANQKPNYKHSAIPKNKPQGHALVLDGGEVKLRLLAERQDSKSVVHVDWVRFTSLLRNAEAFPVDVLFPKKIDISIWDEQTRQNQFDKLLAELPGNEFEASAQAHELAEKAATCLGPDFTVAAEFRKGLDFYKFRWSIERNGQECGWVGFLSASDSPRQQSQSKTLHVNLFGAACTFAAAGWNDRIADLVDDIKATLTRCDLALDFFDGLPGGLDGIVTQYQAGLCNVNGRKPKSNAVGDWFDKKRGRSFYIGSKEAGKQTNIYEKGDQLFGIDKGSDWLRIELRYGNKLRVLESQMLRRPADFFAGASDWHHSMLLIADSQVIPESVPCNERRPLETVEAECVRNIDWMIHTAGPTLAAAIKYLSTDDLWTTLEFLSLPGRLKSFTKAQISKGMTSAFARLTSCGGLSHAFA